MPTWVCGDCHVQPATWFSHPPDECEDNDCNCEAQCQECMDYYHYLIKMVVLIRN